MMHRITQLLFIIQPILFQVSVSSSSSCYLPDLTLATPEKHDLILNDGFCDCSDGSDEIATAACSHLLTKRPYTCPNAIADVTIVIPPSRLQDGICDCCDGSDEKNEFGSMGSICENTCEGDLKFLREDALLWNKNVLEGMHAREELMRTYQLKKNMESKNLDIFKAEKKSIDDTLIVLNKFLAVETKFEDSTRLQLLRNRVDKCAQGITSACQLFKDGILGSDEVPGVDTHAGILGAESRTKFHDQESLQGLSRIKSASCSEDRLMHYHNEKAFLTLDEYLTFFQSESGAAVFRNKNLQQFFLRPFTALSENNYYLGKLIGAEIAGLICSPAVLVTHAAAALMKVYYDAYFEIIENRTIDDIGASADIQPYWYTVLSSFCHRTYEMYKSTRIEGTIVSNIIRFLDPFSYPSVVTVTDFLQPYYLGPSWVFGVILQTPYVYYGYYVEKSHHGMPGTLHACLLRSAIKIAKEELEKIKEKTENEEFLQSEHLEMKSKLGKISKAEKKKNRGQKKNEENKNSGLSVLSHVDFGPNDSWKSAIGRCLEGRFGGYHYDFCYFGKFTQGNTLLGTFKDWGARTGTGAETGKNPIRGNRGLSEEEEEEGGDREGGGSWFPFSRSADQSDGQAGILEDVRNSGSKFSSQLYTNGMICQVGAVTDGQRARRRVQVTLVCGPTEQIREIEEREVCVYDAIVETPLSCTNDMLADSAQRLISLGVTEHSMSTSTSSTTPQSQQDTAV